jgi:tetrahydromethanopterin S-methyltransferase subunit G
MKDKFSEVVDNQKEYSSNFKEIFHRLDVIETKAETNADIVAEVNRRNWKYIGFIISSFILVIAFLRLFGVTV